jgi:hypothetical protein
VHPLDEAAALSERTFSYEIERRGVMGSIPEPFDEGVERITESTRVLVSKLSLEPILVDAATDFASFQTAIRSSFGCPLEGTICAFQALNGTPLFETPCSHGVSDSADDPVAAFDRGLLVLDEPGEPVGRASTVLPRQSGASAWTFARLRRLGGRKSFSVGLRAAAGHPVYAFARWANASIECARPSTPRSRSQACLSRLSTRRGRAAVQAMHPTDGCTHASNPGACASTADARPLTGCADPRSHRSDPRPEGRLAWPEGLNPVTGCPSRSTGRAAASSQGSPAMRYEARSSGGDLASATG